jgi:DNA polymerase III subunit beta
MDVTMKCGALAAELALTANIASRKGSTMPALTHVLLEGEPMSAEVALSATDLEVGVRSSCPAKVNGGGALLLPGKRLHDIARLLPADSDLKLTSNGSGAVRISCGHYDSRMQALPPEDFPPLQAPSGAGSELSGDVLSALIAKVQFAVVEGDQRYFLAGARMEVAPGTLKLVSTDSHRLAVASTTRANTGHEAAVLLTGKCMRELRGLFDGVAGPVTFVLGERHLFFWAGPRLLTSVLVEGQFPKYDRIIPKSHDKRVVVDRDRLSLAVKRVALANSDTSRTVKLSVDDKGITVAASSAEVGDAVERVEVPYTGAPVAVSINAQFAQDFLDATSPGEVALELRDERSAVVFKQVDEKADAYQCVIMPVQQ